MINLSWENIKSALVSALIMAVIGMISYILQVGDIFKIDIKTLINIGVMAGLTAGVSLIKSLFTTKAGNFVGVVKIKK